MSADVSSAEDKNTKSFKIIYKKLAAITWDTLTLNNEQYSLNTTKIIENIDTESEYNFKAVATDYFSFAEYSHNLSMAYTLMDFNKTGKGMTIGKVSTQNAFEVNIDAHFNGEFTINGKSILDLIYPVGSIYMSANSTNPGEMFDGTWTKVPIADYYQKELTLNSGDDRHITCYIWKKKRMTALEAA